MPSWVWRSRDHNLASETLALESFPTLEASPSAASAHPDWRPLKLTALVEGSGTHPNTPSPNAHNSRGKKTSLRRRSLSKARGALVTYIQELCLSTIPSEAPTLNPSLSIDSRQTERESFARPDHLQRLLSANSKIGFLYSHQRLLSLSSQTQNLNHGHCEPIASKNEHFSRK